MERMTEECTMRIINPRIETNLEKRRVSNSVPVPIRHNFVIQSVERFGVYNKLELMIENAENAENNKTFR